MADILSVLPDFSTAPFSHILPSLERNHITTADLLTLDTFDIAKRATVPPRDVQKLTDGLLKVLQDDLGLLSSAGSLRVTGQELVEQWETISTLDEHLDDALAGGIPTRYLTEITGESGAGKTQFLLTLLLAVQLPPPRGLSRTAVYISTESALPTTRVSQLVSSHAYLSTLAPNDKPSTSKILTISTPDLESQEHILRYQLPVAIKRYNVGLVVIDSITANFRAEFDRAGGASGDKNDNTANMARRTAQLGDLGAQLRDLARRENVAIVVSNQVSDRFVPETSTWSSQTTSATTSSTDPASLTTPSTTTTGRETHDHARTTPSASAPLASSTQSVQPPRQSATGINTTLMPPDILTLNHQQRYFTGWGDEALPNTARQKTPSLGLVWTNQIAARIALTKRPGFIRGRGGDGKVTVDESSGAGGETASRWRRHMRVVFAPWARDVDGGVGVEFVIGTGGVKSVQSVKAVENEMEKAKDANE